MKRTRFVHLFLSMLLVFLSLSGCRTAPPPAVTNNIDDLIRAAAQEAIEHAARAKNAQNLANQVSDGNELRTLLNQANEAASAADKAASRAKSLQSQIDDAALRELLDTNVDEAQRAAEEAQAAAAIINGFRTFIAYHQNIRQISLNIIEETITVQDESIRNRLQEVLTHSLCFAVAGALSGHFPARDEIQQRVQTRADLKKVTLTDPNGKISEAIETQAVRLLKALNDDELQIYKEVCETVLKIE